MLNVRRILALLTLSAIAVASFGSVRPASAATVIGSFEVDGDKADLDPSTEPLDWDSLPTDDPAVDNVTFNDGSGNDDDSFGGSSNELEPSGWRFVEQKVPQKDDILEAGIAARFVDGAHWLYLYSERKFDKGSAFISYEFNQLDETFDNDDNPNTPEVPKRKAGDLLIFLRIENGGTDTTIDVFIWNGDHLSGTWDPPQGITPERGVDWEAVTADLGGGTFVFSEAAINLMAFGQTLGCPGLGKAWVKSISSHVFETASLKDRTERKDVNLSNCGSVTVHKVSDEEGQPPLDGAAFELLKDDGDGIFNELTDLQVATCVTGEEGVPGECTFEQVAPGTYFVREVAAPDGYAVDPDVEGPIVVGEKENVVVATTFVNHKLEPAFTVEKAASPATVNLSDGDTTNDVVTYTITVTNVGDGPGSTPVTDDYDQAHLTEITILTPGGANNGDTITWADSGTIAPNGGTAELSYSGRISGTFDPDDAGPDCPGPGDFPVINLVTVTGDSDEAVVCVHAEPALSVAKTADKQTAQIGEQVTYTIAVTNSGPAQGSTPVVDDYDQAHLTGITGIDPASGVDNGDTITWADSGPIAPAGGTAVFSYTGTITGPFDGPSGGDCPEGQFGVINLVTITGDQNGETVCVPADPAFRVTKTASPTEVEYGGSVEYTILVENIGDAPGSTPVVDDYDQAHLTVDDGSIVPDGTDNGDTITWDSGTIPAGGFAVFTYTGVIDGAFNDLPGGGGCDADRFPVVNLVTVIDDDDSATVCVLAVFDPSVTKDASPTTVDLTDGDTSNDIVTYTITVQNNGPASGSTPVVDDYDQAHLIDITIITPGGVDDGDTITWSSSGIIPAFGSATFTYSGRVDGDFTGAPGGNGCDPTLFPVINLVTIEGDDDDAVVCVKAEPDLSVEKTANPTSVDLTDGDTSNDVVTYTITVTNNGAAEGSTPVTDDYDQAHLTDITIITAGGVDNGDTITWADSGLVAPNGGTAVFTYTARITGTFSGPSGSGGCPVTRFPVVNLVTIQDDQDDAQVCVRALPDFEVVKAADPTSIDVSDGDTSNDVVTYTITVTNTGTASGSTPVIDDYDQDHLTDITIITAGGMDDGDTITWASGTIAAGDNASFSYSARIVGPFGPGDAGAECPDPDEFPVLNIVTVDGDEAQAVVCVRALPAFTVEKSADPTTVDLSDGDGSNDTVTYTITVTNVGDSTGSTPVLDDYDESHLVDIVVITPGGTDDGSTITWDSGPIAAGASALFAYSGRIDGPFTSDEAGADCTGANEFPVVNLVTVNGDQDEAVVCVNAEPDLVALKTADKPIVQIDQQVTYTITVTNQGEGPGSTPVEDDYDQEHLTAITGIDPPDGVDDGDTITWADSGTIEPGANKQFSYTGTITGTFEGPSGDGGCGDGHFPVINLVTIDGQGDSETVCVPAVPQFVVEKTANPSSIDLSDGDTSNDVVAYEITVTNIGKASGSTPVVDDYDQDHLTDIAAIDPASGIDDGDTITWDSGPILAGASKTFSYTGRVFGPFTSGEAGPGCEGATEFPVVNLVTVDDDSATATVCANAPPAFVVEKVADPTSVDLGDDDTSNDVVTYTLTVTNVGQGPGSTPVVDDYDQDHLIEIGGIDPATGENDGDTITWDDSGTIEPGLSSEFSYSGRIVGPFTADEASPEPTGACDGDPEFGVVNTVTVTGAEDSNTVIVCAPAVLAVEKSVRNATDEGEFGASAAGEPGDTIEYQIEVTNQGSGEATNVSVTDPVPAHTSFVSCEPMLSCSEADGTVTWTIASIPAKQGVTVSFTVTLLDDFQPGITVIGNVAAASLPGKPPVPSNETTVSVTRLSKAVCATNPTPGAAIEYTIPYGAHGRDVGGVVLEDVLPPLVLFDSATPAPTSAPPKGETGTVRWEFGTLPDGTDAVATIKGHISADAVEGDVLTNTVTLSADGISPTTFTLETEVIEGGDAQARAQGAFLQLLGTDVIGPTPDSDDGNGQLLHLGVLPGSEEVAQVDLLTVQEGSTVDTTSATAHAIATAASVKLLDQTTGPGEDWLVTADAVRAVSSSFADLANAGSSSAGSVLTNVTVDGQNLGTISEPTSITVHDPVLGTTTEVNLLEKIDNGAAAGVEQPEAGLFTSGLTVNAIHVKVTDSGGDLIANLIVSHAESSAEFLSGLACGETLPQVSGTGFALGLGVDETLLDDEEQLVDGEIARVRIPITGGDERSTALHVGPLFAEGNHVIESNTAFTHSVGVIDREANDAIADTEAEIDKLRVLEHSDEPGATDHLLSADLIRAGVHAEATDAETASATGSTTLVDLEIEGNDVCEALGLEEHCSPEPNKTYEVPGVLLVILNEQIEGPGGPGVASLTVNAIHIFVLGEDNALGLPVGAEVVISSAHAGAHAAGGSVEDLGGGEAAGQTIVLPSSAPSPGAAPAPRPALVAVEPTAPAATAERPRDLVSLLPAL